MPEVPELTVTAKVLNARVTGRKIESATVRIPVVVRMPSEPEFIATLTGNRLLETRRVGKYLLMSMETGHVLAVNLMLTSRLQLADKGVKLPRRTSWLMAFENGLELRCFGQRLDARAYLVKVDQLALIPRFQELGPDVLDPSVTFEVFKDRIKRFTGQIKGVLTRGDFLAGIGNAYADEILFEAKVYPFEPSRKVPPEKLRAIYDAIHKVYAWAVPIAEERMGERIDIKVRDFLKVHRKGGQPCLVCGSPIAEVSPNERTTSYCRTCQGWGEAKLRGSSMRPAAPVTDTSVEADGS